MNATTNQLKAAFESRSNRVLAMLGIALIIQIADLCLTSHSMATVGMWEVNPIVLQIMRWSESLWALAAFKTATIMLGFGILFAARHRWSGELGAMAALIISAFVGVMWVGYLIEMSSISAEDIALLSTASSEGWIQLR